MKKWQLRRRRKMIVPTIVGIVVLVAALHDGVPLFTAYMLAVCTSGAMLNQSELNHLNDQHEKEK